MILERFGSSEGPADEEDESRVAPAMKDQPTTDDKLGFGSYVEALEAFLTHENTDPPLTLSVEGEWGIGKSSFMLQLKDRLRRKDHLTVQFNPWRHEQEDALWAAFALEFFREVSDQIPFYRRWWGHLKLSVRRFRWKMGWLEMLRAASIGLVVLVITIVTLVGLLAVGPTLLDLLFRVVPGLQPLRGIVGPVLGTGGVALSLAGLVTLWIRISEQIVNPIETDLQRYIEKPEYQDRVSFIEQFHADFRRIIDSYIGDRRVFVFVDDLDRCEIPKAAELMQSINLMIATDPRLVFIVGMDREKVAAGIAAKYDDLLPYLNTSNSPDTGRDIPYQRRRGVEFGYRYLEKFIQIPFLVPEPTPRDINRLLSPVHTDDDSSDSPPNVGNNRDGVTRDDLIAGVPDTVVLDEDSRVLREVVRMVAPTLNHNPRMVKKFVNLFRLRAILAGSNGLFDWMHHGHYDEADLTLQQLGKFVAISLRWPRLLSELSSRPDLLKRLHEAATASNLSEDELDPKVRKWARRDELMNLVRSGFNTDPDNFEQYSLAAVNVDHLLQISPRVDQPTKTEQRGETVEEQERVHSLDGFVERAREMDSSFGDGEILK